MNTERRCVGVMSGTSRDGIDVALCTFSGSPSRPKYRLNTFRTSPYEETFRSRLKDASDMRPPDLARLHTELGRKIGRAVNETLSASSTSPSSVQCIGSHGHTVYHGPDADPPSTTQIGDAAIIAEETGVPVISDFRPGDMAAGGEGAPLIPRADQLLWGSPDRNRVLVNLGGFANITYMPAGNHSGQIMAFDAGPCNVLLNDLARRAGLGEMDEDGQTALQGEVIEDAVSKGMDDPYFQKPPPKSTGRRYFSRNWIENWLDQFPSDTGKPDLLATGNALVARSVLQAIREFLPETPDDVILTGGGRKNKRLVNEFTNHAGSMNVQHGEEAGIESDAREAIGFALFGWLSEHGEPVNIPSATGADRPVVLGKRTPPTGRPT